MSLKYELASEQAEAARRTEAAAAASLYQRLLFPEGQRLSCERLYFPSEDYFPLRLCPRRFILRSEGHSWSAGGDYSKEKLSHQMTLLQNDCLTKRLSYQLPNSGYSQAEAAAATHLKKWFKTKKSPHS